METFSGEAECKKDGKFDWRGYKLSNGEAAFSSEWNDLRMNFIEVIEENGNKKAIVQCPKCKGRIVVDL